MILDKYSELKIAGNILGFTMQEFAKENNTSVQVIRDVAMGYTTSARLSKAINERIEEAEKIYRQHCKQNLTPTK